MNPNPALAYAALGILPCELVNSKTGVSRKEKSSSFKEKKRSSRKKEKLPVSNVPRFRTSMVKA